MTLLLIDPSNGASGDMLLAAIASLGDARSLLKEVERAFGTRMVLKRRETDHWRGLGVEVGSGRRLSPSEMMEEVMRAAGALKLDEEGKRRCRDVLNTLFEAERKVHGSSDLHLHELAELDTIVDVVGTIYLLNRFGFDEVLSLPIALGRGAAPATLEILRARAAAFRVVDEDHELCTPTAAAILTNIARFVHSTGSLVVEKVGYGIGRDATKRPNVLKVLQCEPIDEKNEYVVETNIDDMSGEQLAYVAERLLEEGAKDVCMIPMIAKKGRPGVILQAVCDGKDVDRLTEILFEETTTIGVRSVMVNRRVLERKVRSVAFKGEKVRVKISGEGRKMKVKPEYEDARRLAKKKKLPLRKIYDEISRRFGEE